MSSYLLYTYKSYCNCFLFDCEIVKLDPFFLLPYFLLILFSFAHISHSFLSLLNTSLSSSFSLTQSFFILLPYLCQCVYLGARDPPPSSRAICVCALVLIHFPNEELVSEISIYMRFSHMIFLYDCIEALLQIPATPIFLFFFYQQVN